jgi:hypothetical protein
MNLKLPIGIQTFSDLRQNGYLYVDKTHDIYNMISSGKSFFFSRPRRFGKSLLVSTLASIFKGEKSLFEGLYIADKIEWNETYPVIKLDWSSLKHNLASQMEEGMAIYLKGIAAGFDIVLGQIFSSNRFEELLTAIHKKTGRQVVVLIDEYDMPILDALDVETEEIDEIRKYLQSIYTVLKTADEHLRFVFLTGVSKFAKVSIFSGLNNLRDITLDAEYATLCGYTQSELERYFDPFIKEMAESERVSTQELLNRIRHWYNGFSWDGVTTVYNSFSTLLLFAKKEMQNYWFETGTPTFLINLIKERNDIKFLLASSTMSDTAFNSFDPHSLASQILMFQTGYLTVKKKEKDRFGAGIIYTLGVPNEEVRQSMFQYLTSSFTAYPVSSSGVMRSRMMSQLFDGDVSAFEKSAQELFAHIPYQLHIPREAY